MSTKNCECGGNSLEKFYSLFTCDHANCMECVWTNNKCCGYSDSSSDSVIQCNSNCINFYDINMQEVITSKIKSFGFCITNEDEETGIITGALAIKFTDVCKKLFLNVNKEIYDSLLNANKDFMYINLEQNICSTNNQCIMIP